MNDFNVINVEHNIIINLDEEDHFNISYQMIYNGQFIFGGEGYNEIENISESNEEQFSNNFTSQNESRESSQVFGRSNSLCIISESKIPDPLNTSITKKSKSCKNLIYCKKI